MAYFKNTITKRKGLTRIFKYLFNKSLIKKHNESYYIKCPPFFVSSKKSDILINNIIYKKLWN